MTGEQASLLAQRQKPDHKEGLNQARKNEPSLTLRLPPPEGEQGGSRSDRSKILYIQSILIYNPRYFRTIALFTPHFGFQLSWHSPSGDPVG